jgi:transcriptional regulator with XRE-family HTH domain
MQSGGRTRLTPEEVGQRIRLARLERRWTHEELAHRMGANWRTVQRWQNGQLPRLPTLLRLADVLGVPPAQFVDVDDGPVTLNELDARVGELAARVEALAQSLRSLERKLDEPPVRNAAQS